METDMEPKTFKFSQSNACQGAPKLINFIKPKLTYEGHGVVLFVKEFEISLILCDTGMKGPLLTKCLWWICINFNTRAVCSQTHSVDQITEVSLIFFSTRVCLCRLFVGLFTEIAWHMSDHV